MIGRPRRFFFFYDEVRQQRYLYDAKYDISHNMSRFEGWSYGQIVNYLGYSKHWTWPYFRRELIALGWCHPKDKGYNHTITKAHRPERPPKIDGAEFEESLQPRRKISEMG